MGLVEFLVLGIIGGLLFGVIKPSIQQYATAATTPPATLTTTGKNPTTFVVKPKPTATTATAAGGAPPTAWKFAFKWGTQGLGNGQFQNIEGIAVDADGNVYAGDWKRHDIQKFSPTGQFIKRFGGPVVGKSGAGKGEFYVPFSLKFDPRDGHLWVADQFNNRIQKIDRNTGAYMTQVGPTIPGLTDPPTLGNPEDVDFDPVDHSMYIMDPNNRRVVKLDANFKYVTKWGTPQKHFMEGMTVNPINRNIYITDYVVVAIWVYDPQGQLLFKFGTEGTGPGQLTNILERNAIDKVGRFYQLDANKAPKTKVVVYDAKGKFISEFGSGPGAGDGQFCDAEQIAVGKDYTVYIADQCNHRIQCFKPVATSASTSTSTTAFAESLIGTGNILQRKRREG